MATLVLRLFLVVVLAGTVVRPAAAQTARIAHFSHGGSVETLAADGVTDNFGTPPHFQLDSVRILSDTTAVEYGWWINGNGGGRLDTLHWKNKHIDNFEKRSWQETAKYYRGVAPKIKIIGADGIQKKSASAPVPKDAPLPRKQKTKRKKAALLPVAPVLPQHPGVALAVAALLVLTAAGWLLGGRPRPMAGSVA